VVRDPPGTRLLQPPGQGRKDPPRRRRAHRSDAWLQRVGVEQLQPVAAEPDLQEEGTRSHGLVQRPTLLPRPPEPSPQGQCRSRCRGQTRPASQSLRDLARHDHRPGGEGRRRQGTPWKGDRHPPRHGQRTPRAPGSPPGHGTRHRDPDRWQDPRRLQPAAQDADQRRGGRQEHAGPGHGHGQPALQGRQRGLADLLRPVPLRDQGRRRASPPGQARRREGQEGGRPGSAGSGGQQARLRR